MNDVDKVLKLADAEVGYLEKKSNKDLDHKTNNAGSNNYTKYARDYKAHTGINVQAQAWCDTFIDELFINAYGVENAKRMLGGWSAYTPTSANYFKNNNRYYKTPKTGDVIFFRNSERIYHTGLVVDVTSTRVHTIEGNTSSASGVVENGGGVFKKSYPLNYSKIDGYGRPTYDTIPTSTITPMSSKEDIKWLQKSLNNVDIIKSHEKPFGNLSIDGDYGNKTRIMTLILWEKLGWNKDGKDDGWKVGKKTIERLKK